MTRHRTRTTNVILEVIFLEQNGKKILAFIM